MEKSKSKVDIQFDQSDIQYINNEIDPYEKWSLDKKNYIPNYMGIDKIGPVSILTGQSTSGKSNLLMQLMKNKLIFEYELENIYIFSMTCKTDLAYRPLFKLYVDNELKPKIFTKIDFKKIESIIKEQESHGFEQMTATKKEDVEDLTKILFIYDDMMQDKLFKRYDSQLAMFSCLC